MTQLIPRLDMRKAEQPTKSCKKEPKMDWQPSFWHRPAKELAEESLFSVDALQIRWASWR